MPIEQMLSKLFSKLNDDIEKIKTDIVMSKELQNLLEEVEVQCRRGEPCRRRRR